MCGEHPALSSLGVFSDLVNNKGPWQGPQPVRLMVLPLSHEGASTRTFWMEGILGSGALSAGTVLGKPGGRQPSFCSHAPPTPPTPGGPSLPGNTLATSLSILFWVNCFCVRLLGQQLSPLGASVIWLRPCLSACHP